MDLAALIRALAFAAERHRHQRRKDVDASPYINHPIDVARVLAVEAGIDDVTLLVAALLHDTVEDTETSFGDLEKEFGRAVADLVAEVTDDKELPKLVRKELQVKHAASASERAKRLKIADKICNIRDIAEKPPSTWPWERRREYLEWTQQVVAGCRGVHRRLEEIYDATLAAGYQKLDRDREGHPGP